MRKNLIKNVLSLFLSVVVVSTTVFAEGFSDLSTNHQNHDAILYLQSKGILEGYADGTFQPSRDVNRAEFLKIIIEGSNIDTNVAANTPFNDVDHQAWYAPYIKKAYSEGWVEGYSDGTFKPNQTINKVEALKILALVQQWELPTFLNSNPYEDVARLAWYAKYVAYAKNQEYLEETGTTFNPGQNMTRANISEIIYRTLVDPPTVDTPGQDPVEIIIENPAETEAETPVENPTENNTLNFKPVTPSNVSIDFFENITLDAKLPNTFYEDEVYILTGKVNTSSQSKATVFIESIKGNETAYYVFNDDLENGFFSIPVFFSDRGNSRTKRL